MALDIKSKLPLSLDIPKSAAGNISTGDKVKDWINNYFHMTPTIASLTILSKFQNDIKNSENLAATYCVSQVGAVIVRFDKFEPLVGTSSTYLMPGEEMTVTAGLGAFSEKVKPVVNIDGASIQVNANGVAEKKFNVGGTGSRSMNVSVSYVDPNTGENKTVSKKIDYTVGSPSGVAVSADKMNVLYIGVDNPVTITAGAGSEKVSAQFSGGSISKVGGSKYIVKPSAGMYGDHTITVLVEGKSAGKVGFRVKQLPNPTAHVGDLKPGSVSTATFKAEGGVLADLESDFDAPFTVVSYSVTAFSQDIPDSRPIPNKGQPWVGEAASLINRLKPGSFVTISEIVVRGPGGATTKLPGNISYNLK